MARQRALFETGNGWQHCVIEIVVALLAASICVPLRAFLRSGSRNLRRPFPHQPGRLAPARPRSSQHRPSSTRCPSSARVLSPPSPMRRTNVPPSRAGAATVSGGTPSSSGSELSPSVGLPTWSVMALVHTPPNGREARERGRPTLPLGATALRRLQGPGLHWSARKDCRW
jgi:hypothetical protein